MPRMSGIEAAKTIKEEIPGVFVVILTAFEDASHLDKALEAGADGYLTKDISSRQLLEALHKVLKGERVFSHTILKLLQKKFVSYDRQYMGQVSISKREQIILNFIANGRTSREIADALNISLRTVQSHRYNIMRKLDINTASSLVRFAVLNLEKQGANLASDCA
jgi:DNA-binding NarL/FixJ family response regulator